MNRSFILLLNIFFLCPLIIQAQEGTGACENGFGILKLNKKLSEIKSFLVKADTAKIRFYNDPEMRDGFTSFWLVSLKKAKMETYMGQKVTSIEVYFQKAYDAQGKQIDDEAVAEFVIYFEPPTDFRGFRASLLEYYGAAIPMVSEEGEPAGYTWFGPTTLLDVLFGYDGLEKTGIWLAHFTSSVG